MSSIEFPSFTMYVSGVYEWSGQCVKDNATHVLSQYVATTSTNTPALCMKLCHDKGYLYAGVEAGSMCNCGNTPPPESILVNEDQCNLTCSGDATQTCGGDSMMDVYNTGNVIITSP